MLGVVQLFPEPCDVPPVETSHQLTVPADAVAPNPTVPGPHLEFGVVPEIVGTAFTDTAYVLKPVFPTAVGINTLILPPALPAVTVIVVVPLPAVILQVPGTVHVYVEAFTTGAILYVYD